MKRMNAALLLALAIPVFAVATEDRPFTLYRMGSVKFNMVKGDKYGVMLINAGTEKEPKARYILAISKSRTLVDTQDIEVFKVMLDRIPKGSTIHFYDSCTVYRSWGLKKGTEKGFLKLIEDRRHKISKDVRITCYCEL